MINDANFKPLAEGVTLYPGQRVIKIGNRMFPVGIGNNSMPAKGGNSMEFYKCASVDTSANTWSGYKAILTDGVYSFEDTTTDALAYTENFPFPGSAYTSDLSVTVDELQQKKIADISGGEVVGQRYVFTESQTLATGYFTYRKLNSGWSLMWHVVTHGWDRDYYHIIAVGLDASAVRMDASGYNYEPVSFSVDGDSRTWYYCKSQGVGANDGFNPIFDGKPIDVGSNGEDYLAQAKELLNNYLAGTIIGEVPDSPDNGDSVAYKVIDQSDGAFVGADVGEYTEISAAELDALYPLWDGASNSNIKYYTNHANFRLFFNPDTNLCHLQYAYPQGERFQWEAVAITNTEGVNLPATGSWTGGFDVVAYSGGGVSKTYKYTVNGFGGNTEAANGDYYEVNPDSVYSTVSREKGIYYNGTYYLCYVNDAWNGWCIVRDIATDPVSQNGADRPAVATSAETPDKADWGSYTGTLDYKVTAYAGNSGSDKTYVYTVSGAGTAEANGDYWETGDGTYTNGTCTMFFESASGDWYLGADPTAPYYYRMGGNPLGNWTVFKGTAPAPTVTPYAG